MTTLVRRIFQEQDADMSGREIKRKQYASELYHLTATEIAEEEALYVEVKRLQQVERRYRSDRDDLMRTVMGLDSGLMELDQDNTEAILGVDKVSLIVARVHLADVDERPE